MDKKCAFLSKTRTFLSDPKLLNGSVCVLDKLGLFSVTTELTGKGDLPVELHEITYISFIKTMNTIALTSVMYSHSTHSDN